MELDIHVEEAMVAALTSEKSFTSTIWWVGPNNGSFKHRESKVEVKGAGKFKEAKVLLPDLLVPETWKVKLRDDLPFQASVAAPKAWKSGKPEPSDICPASCLCPNFSHPCVFSLRQK